ncbi:Arginase/deacetylase [Hanseniaspora valbyensis NRRL Y-1626]|uniref:Arginase/deacetylase n=1 Tax=Hanseniaspora valbyensis NRRL Y-1626 TaxID=766949 RepID=A0A1B7TBR9_9ASCO|nr:Arginase/deacetylase [Hanseniaspora valbyensis NRRL Y-1626]
MKFSLSLLLLCFTISAAHSSYESLQQNPNYHAYKEQSSEGFSINSKPSLEDLWGPFWAYQGIQSFAHLPFQNCLMIDKDSSNDSELFDIAIIGVPFDTATSFRSGTRFGPQGIRSASMRQDKWRGFNFRAGINPFDNWANILDCGDIPVTPMDNTLALKQMQLAYKQLLSLPGNTSVVPRYMSLGGDHSILLPILQGLYEVYGEITVIHFDSHLDTWAPDKYPSFWSSNTSEFTHGSMLWLAHKYGLMAQENNLHVGLRTRLSDDGWEDYEEDNAVGFKRIVADALLDEDGLSKVVDQILKTLPKDKPVYISVDIDVLDPSAAPGTGTMEVGGLTNRELIHILRKMKGLNIVGADVVEVSPPYDTAEITTTAAAQIAYELMTLMVENGPITEEFINKNKKVLAHSGEDLRLTALDRIIDEERKYQINRLFN